MKRFIAFLIICFIIMIPACSILNSDVDSNIEIKDDSTLCGKSCENIQALNCPEGEPLVYPNECKLDKDCADGVCIDNHCTETCEMLCKALIKEGRQLGLECWQTILTCEEIETVCRNK